MGPNSNSQGRGKCRDHSALRQADLCMCECMYIHIALLMVGSVSQDCEIAGLRRELRQGLESSYLDFVGSVISCLTTKDSSQKCCPLSSLCLELDTSITLSLDVSRLLTPLHLLEGSYCACS